MKNLEEFLAHLNTYMASSDFATIKPDGNDVAFIYSA
jgi:hypothetical protein